MKRFLAILLITVLACTEETSRPVPENLIPKDKMILLVVDLQTLESHYQRTYGRPDLYADALDSSSYYVFNNHGVTKDQFEKSLDFYSWSSDTLYSIYEGAFDTLLFRNSNLDLTE